ncbi:MAG: phosphotransferase [Actinobacteria bacterium]|uniref:Unannotated protein n=1 Tax=freshwater metagenome TaxID=449393 RepID=A0A6J6QGW3_9ZZZZ|nr:phosphotransferase [Actinomycetota bacterium]
MTPRATGVRAPYDAVPVAVRAWVDSVLGSPVVTVAEQVGGMSPGCATRVTCADGTRAFVKAVGAELNPDSPTLFRREILALTLIGSHQSWADLMASYDDGAWVALVLEDIEGRHPDLADDTDMDLLLGAVDSLGVLLGERVPDPPRPAPWSGEGPRPAALFRPGLCDLSETFRDWLDAFDQAHELPAGQVPSWVIERQTVLRPGVAALLDQPTDRLVHFDIRDDNLLVRPTGELVFLDWGATGIGPDWLDPLLARLERVHLPWFDASVVRSPALARAGDGTVTSWLVGMGVTLAWRAHTQVVVGLPTLQAFRRAESARFLSAAARRLGI